jgi:hypothetical protein
MSRQLRRLEENLPKAGFSFWAYLTDLALHLSDIPPLPDVTRQRALGMPRAIKELHNAPVIL